MENNMWISFEGEADVPSEAVVLSTKDNICFYIGRAVLFGDMRLGVVALDPALDEPAYCCTVGADGSYKRQEFEVLNLSSYAWKFCEHGEVPAGAVAYGFSWDGEPLYIGRSYGEQGQVLIGQINSKLGVCFFPSAMTETSRYECLVVDTRPCTKGTPNAKTHLYEKRLSMLESKFSQMNKTRTEASGSSPQASVSLG